jgi:cytochrome c
MLPFTRDQFLAVFAAYNEAIWPAQVVAYILGAASVVMLFRALRSADLFTAATLGTMWLWTGFRIDPALAAPARLSYAGARKVEKRRCPMRWSGLLGFVAAALIGPSSWFAAAQAPAASPADLVAAGEKVFLATCQRCHTIGPPTKFKKPGPHLNELFGRKPGGLTDYKRYSEELVAFGQDKVWDEATLTTYIRDPQGVVKNTKMAILGLKKDDEIKAVLAYLATFDPDGAAR